MAARGRPGRSITTYPILLRVPEPLHEQLEAYYQGVLSRPLAAGEWHRPSRNDVLLSLLAEALQGHVPKPAEVFRQQEMVQAGIPPFDATKYRLGTLCKHGHEWGNSGQSLRKNKPGGYCLVCNNGN